MKIDYVKHFKTLRGARIAAAYAIRTAKFSRVNVFRSIAKTRTGLNKKSRDGALKSDFAVYYMPL